MSGLALKVVGIPALVAVTWLFVSQGATYVEMRDFAGGKAAIMQVARTNATMGASTYGGSLALRLLMAPFLLIRPFPFEVHNLQASFASLEGVYVLFLFVRRRKILYRTLGRIRSNPFAMFLALYAVEFTIIIYAAATTNFGLLNRQRVMLMPFALMMFLSDSRFDPKTVSVPLRVLRLRRRSLEVASRSGIGSPAAGD